MKQQLKLALTLDTDDFTSYKTVKMSATTGIQVSFNFTLYFLFLFYFMLFTLEWHRLMQDCE